MNISTFKDLFKIKNLPEPTKVHLNSLYWTAENDFLEVFLEKNGTVIKYYKHKTSNCDVLWVPFGKEKIAKSSFISFFRKCKNAQKK